MVSIYETVKMVIDLKRMRFPTKFFDIFDMITEGQRRLLPLKIYR